MKKQSLIYLLITAMPLTAFAQEGSGARNGGNTLDVNGTPRLFELVTKAHCEWKMGTEIYRTTPDLDLFLKRISKLDWYLAEVIKREIIELKFCMTGQLFKVDPQDKNSPVLGDIKKFHAAKQAGIRVNQEVFVDQSEFDGMKHPGDQATFVIHEAIHSFFPSELEDRKGKVRGTTAMLSQAGKGRVHQLSELYFQLSQDQMNYPFGASVLNPIQDALKFLVFADADERRRLLMNADRPESLIDIGLEQVNRVLLKRDQIEVDPRVSLEKVLVEVLINGTDAEFNQLLNEKSYEHVNLSVLGLSAYSQLSEERRSRLIEHASLRDYIDQVLTKLAKIEPALERFGIYASNDLQAWSTSQKIQNKIEVTRLIPRHLRGANPALPIEIAGLANLAITFLNTGRADTYDQYFRNNPNFHAALSLNHSYQTIERSTLSLEEEKLIALQSIKALSDGMINQWWRVVYEGIQPGLKTDFETQIQFAVGGE